MIHVLVLRWLISRRFRYCGSYDSKRRMKLRQKLLPVRILLQKL